MPEFPIVDTHVHLWDPKHFPIAWLEGIESLNRRYALPEYVAATTGIEVASMVYVQVEVDPAYALLEAQWVVDRAQEDPRLQAIVAWAPLEHGDRVRSFLAALASIDPRVKGVRRLIQGESDQEFAVRPGFIRGVQLLPEFGLACEMGIVNTQLAATIELVQQCPETSFMLNHLGKPNVKAHQLEPWRAELSALAALPNVMCKISGVVTEADLEHWTPEDIAPYILHALDAFGEDRVVFGSDWPVVTLASSYTRWVATLDAMTAHLSDGARRKLWAGNARRFYRLRDEH